MTLVNELRSVTLDDDELNAPEVSPEPSLPVPGFVLGPPGAEGPPSAGGTPTGLISRMTAKDDLWEDLRVCDEAPPGLPAAPRGGGSASKKRSADGAPKPSAEDVLRSHAAVRRRSHEEEMMKIGHVLDDEKRVRLSKSLPGSPSTVPSAPAVTPDFIASTILGRGRSLWDMGMCGCDDTAPCERDVAVDDLRDLRPGHLAKPPRHVRVASF